MNVHDIHTKKDAAVLADLRAVGSTIEPPAGLDAVAMATSAVRNVRRRRVVTTVTACVAAVVLTGAGIGAAGALYADRQEPLPGMVKTTVPTPAEPTDALDTAPTEEQRTGDGTLPVLPDVEHGVPQDGAPYVLGGLWYTVPAGEWTTVGDVNAGGVAGWLDEDHPEAQGPGENVTIDDMDATIEMRNVTDVADWTVPARDSGATTVDIEGADLVVIEQHAPEEGVRPVTVTVRSGAEGWVIDTRFAADAEGDKALRDFVGNLWLEEEGVPDWYQPELSPEVLGAVERGVPAGWVPTEHNGLRFALPEGWTSKETEGEHSPGVDWTGTTITHVEPGADPELLGQMGNLTEKQIAEAAEDKDMPEQVMVQGGKPGGSWWTPTVGNPRAQMIDVPGADYAELVPTVYTVDGEVDYYWAQLFLHQEDQGENLFLVLEFDGTEQGLRNLHTFLGTLDFRR
ncbi:hypothetical protein GCM10010413_55100 [Promicromonospora sukumoe]|uniref:Uncharacterized protein n=1 Tax=Promicromonospora sukumoe TaxID=88382 RepID=A0A7W3PGA2_9MICO|nr:hypothetical protein [Promicromonospora sukumoe]MBA8810763.1 hypothetical protein [Promicromonospora sukumoe]